MNNLPGFVSSKIADLTEHRDQLRSWAMASMSRADHDRARLGQIKQALQATRGTGFASIGPGYGPSEQQIAETDREVGELELKIQTSVEAFARRKLFADAADQTLNLCRDYLARLPESVELEQLPPVAICAGDVRKMLALVRRDLAEEQSQLARLRALPPPLIEVEQRVREWVTRKASAARITLRAPRRQPLEVGFLIQSALGPSTTHADPMGLACMLDPERVVTLLMTEAERHPHAAEGVTDAEFDKRIAKLTAKIDDLGWSEEALVCEVLQASPTATTRRSDAKPEHLLGCRVASVTAMAKQAA